MSTNLGLDGLRKAAQRAKQYLGSLAEEAKPLSEALARQRQALDGADATASEDMPRQRIARQLRAMKNRVAGKVSPAGRAQDIRQPHFRSPWGSPREDASLETGANDEAREKSRQRRRSNFKAGVTDTWQRYRRGQGVVDKIGAVSAQAMDVARKGSGLLTPGYQTVTGTGKQGPGSNPASGNAAAPAAAATDNLAGDIGKLNSAINAVSVDIFVQLDGTLRSLTQAATGMLQGVDRWIQNNPTLAGGITQLAAGAVMLTGALGSVGSVVVPVLSGINLLMTGAGLLSSVFTFAGGAIVAALGAIALPIGFAIAAVVALAGAALAIYAYWEPVSAFFAGVMRGISAAFAPLAESFKPLMQAFERVGSKIVEAIDNIKGFFTPLEKTAQQLQEVGNLGELVGRALVNGLSLAMGTLRVLGKMVGWVLEKLGLVDKKSSDVAEKMPRAVPESDADPALTNAEFGALDAPAALAVGGARYQPVMSKASNSSQQNTFNSSYVINTHPGMSDSDVLAMIERHQQQEKFAAGIKQRSSVWG